MFQIKYNGFFFAGCMFIHKKKKSSAIWPHRLPDGFRVDVHRCDSLQQKFHHLQEWVWGLLGECQLPCDFPLEKQYHSEVLYRFNTTTYCWWENVLVNIIYENLSGELGKCSVECDWWRVFLNLPHTVQPVYMSRWGWWVAQAEDGVSHLHPEPD